MITANPTTNTPQDNWPASATDAAGSRDAGGQGRPSRELAPETKRRHIALFAMATEGLPAAANQDALHLVSMKLDTERIHGGFEMCIAHGLCVYESLQVHGRAAVKSVNHARALRMLLGMCAGRFDGIEHDSLARDGVSLLHIAEIRMGIRTRNGDLRREWM